MAILTLLWPLLGPHILNADWGFDQLNYIPDYLFIIWLVMASGVFAVMFITPEKHMISELLKDYFWGEKKKAGRIAAIALALIIFIIFRFQAHVYGDGYINISNFAQRMIPIFPYYEFGGTFIPYLFYLVLKAVGISQIASAVWAYQIVSFLSAGVFLTYSFKLADHIGETHDGKIAFLLMLWFTGLSLVFFGFIEKTVVILPAGLIFIYYLVRLSEKRSLIDLLILWIVAIFGLFVNIMFLTTVPVLLYISLKTIIKRRHIGAFAGTLTAYISIISGLIALFGISVGNLALERHFLYFSGKQPLPDYWLFSPSRLADLFNLTYLLVPIFILFLTAIILRIKKLKKDNIYSALGLMAIPQIALMFIMDTDNGLARDYHIFGFLFLGFIVWGAYAAMKLARDHGFSKDVYMAYCPIALVILLPMFLVHLNYPMTEKYLFDYLNKNDFKYEPALYAMRDYYFSNGDFETATERENSIRGKAPGILESNLINDLFARQRVDEAMEYALRLTERFPFNPVYHLQKANLLKYYNRFQDAEKEYLTAMNLNKYQMETYHFLSELYREKNLEAKCIKTINDGLAIEPDNKMLLIDQTGYYFRAGKHKKVDSLCNVISKIDPDEPYCFMYRGLISEGAKRYEKAMENYEKFVEKGTNLPEVGAIRKRINNIYLMLNDSTSQK